MPTPPYKIPRSVLVVVYAPASASDPGAGPSVLLMERASWPGFWQSVTGSLDREDEPLRDTAVREVAEETGLDAERYTLIDCGIEHDFEIFAKHLPRYAPGVTHNREHVFKLELPTPLPVALAPAEHSRYRWLPWREAAELTLSWTNRDAILALVVAANDTESTRK